MIFLILPALSMRVNENHSMLKTKAGKVGDIQSSDVFLDDPLKDVTRKERKMLLGISVLAIVLVKTGLVPTKISALGVEFSETHQQALLLIVSLVDIYFLFAFVIYATTDFFVWRKALVKASRDEIKEHYESEADLLRKEEAENYGPSGHEGMFEEQLDEIYQ